MKLFMQQNGFVWGKPFPLCDKSGRTRYTITSEAYSLGKRLHVFDLAGREAIHIRQVIPSMFPTFEIEVYGRPIGSIVKDPTFFEPQFLIQSLNWEISGVITLYDYEIFCQNVVLASSRPVASENGPQIVYDSFDRSDKLTALAVMLTINCCMLSPQKPVAF